MKLNITLTSYKKKLIYRSEHRGCKETDIIFGQFASEMLDSLDESQLKEYEQLLDVPDVDFYNWITGIQQLPANFNNSVFSLIKENHFNRYAKI